MNKPLITIYSMSIFSLFFKKTKDNKKPCSLSMSTILNHIDSNYIKKIKRVL